MKVNLNKYTNLMFKLAKFSSKRAQVYNLNLGIRKLNLGEQEQMKVNLNKCTNLIFKATNISSKWA